MQYTQNRKLMDGLMSNYRVRVQEAALGQWPARSFLRALL